MRANKIHVDVQKTLGQPPYWLCEVMEDWEYKNGQRTGTLLGYKYATAIPALSLERIMVKIPGDKLIEIEEGEIVEVAFENLELGVYVANNGQPTLTAKATGITEVINKKG